MRFPSKHTCIELSSLLLFLAGAMPAAAHPRGEPTRLVDLAEVTAGTDPVARIYGAGVETGFGLGAFGIPVAGGADLDGDGFPDYALAHFLSSPFDRVLAGEVHLVFGDGTLERVVDTSVPQAGVLRIVGSGNLEATEMAGTEIWMGEVTGDGIGDLLIGRQNYSFDDPSGPRIGAGALTVLVGGPELRAFAASGQVLDLASPPPSLTLLTLLGSHAGARLGIWVRSGDVDGDGIGDIAVGSDQESDPDAEHRGAVYIVRGGEHLGHTLQIDLADFGTTPIAGHLARIRPPAGSVDFHLGATLAVGDLDGNGRSEVIAAAALGRSSASVEPVEGFPVHVFGGVPGGRVYILWDDAVPEGHWPAGLDLDLGAFASTTAISGGAQNAQFGEALLGGLDYNGDRRAELFVGDLGGDGSAGGDKPTSGIGYVFYRAKRLRGLEFNIDDPPPGRKITKILGPSAGALGADTVAHGDFNGDGIGDLMFGSPTASPDGRGQAGVIDLFFGRRGRWPRLIDTTPGSLPPRFRVKVTEIWGAAGTTEIDFGDVLCYAAAAGDIDLDGKTDLLSNEMGGNSPTQLDVGNLVILSGELLSPWHGYPWP